MVFENDHIEEEETVVIQRIMEDKKMDKKKLREKHPDIYKELKVILKHVDVRLHGYVFRKCHPRERNCSYCKNNPRRGSDQMWKCLPKKSSGGLFFDCEKDPERPGHYKTLLDLLKEGTKIKIKPDAMYEGYDRCQVSPILRFLIFTFTYSHILGERMFSDLQVKSRWGEALSPGPQ